ncbi:alpha/beta hydrolase [Luteococcus sp. H138]|uniref:alpha/beta fold hydrolase n=1 Tax=unclassified Luteococcus TaxID=2639923 RepID=UPI00313AFF37
MQVTSDVRGDTVDARWAGFKDLEIATTRGRLHALAGGQGRPVLLLHGYPQTHEMWHAQARCLAEGHRVIAPDLRGYGQSVSTCDDFSFRAMAEDMVELMATLGHESFDVIGHDRGARVAHRMALDHDQVVRSLALLDILPTLDVWRQMDAGLGLRYYHWLFLAQGGRLPETLINARPLFYLEHALRGLGGSRVTFDEAALASYRRAAENPSVVEAWCKDYQSAATVDRDHDLADQGRTSEVPTLVLWGEEGTVPLYEDPLPLWQAWFPSATGTGLPGGHFIAEECPDQVTARLIDHLAGSARESA